MVWAGLQATEQENPAESPGGKRMFEAAELRQIIDTASHPLKAMILLGINCGFGQSDIASLTESAGGGGWINYARPKTGIKRRCPLWPKTVKAIRDAIAKRPDPRETEEADLLFRTHHGNRWVRLNAKNTPNDEIGKQLTKLLNDLGIKRKGVSFYALRHTFETIGGR